MAEVLFRAKLQREEAHTPWGFRLQGGVEYKKPLTLLKVQDNSIAARSGLHAGDIVVKLAGKQADDMTHKKAQQSIVSAGNVLEIIVERADVTIATSSDTTRAETPEDETEKIRTKNGPKQVVTEPNGIAQMRGGGGAATSSDDTDGSTSPGLDTNANTIAPSKCDCQRDVLRETKPPVDTVISSPNSHRNMLNLTFTKQRDDSLEGSPDSSAGSSGDSVSSQNAQNSTVIPESDSNTSLPHVKSVGVTCTGWSSASSDSDDSASIHHPPRVKPLLLANTPNSNDELQGLKDSKYPWRRARHEGRRARLHVRSVSEPARCTQPPGLIGPSSLPKKSISVANLLSSDTKSHKSSKSSLASVSEEAHEDKPQSNNESQARTPTHNATDINVPAKKKLTKQNAMEETGENSNANGELVNKETRKLSNAEYKPPTVNDIYFAAKDPDVIGISLPQVKDMVADLNSRLETIAVNHPKLVSSPVEIGLTFTSKDTAEQSVHVEPTVPYGRQDSSSGDEKDMAIDTIPPVERERSLDSGTAKQSSSMLSPTSNNLKTNMQTTVASSPGANSPQIGRKVHFADPPESKVIEIEPSERRRRKVLAATSERRREDKYPDFYKTRESDTEQSQDEDIGSPAPSADESKPVKEDTEVKQSEESIDKEAAESDSLNNTRPKIAEIAYASSSVRELAERLDRIERENEIFRNNKEPQDTDKPIITKDITGRTYAVTPNPVTTTSKEQVETSPVVSQQNGASGKQQVILQAARPTIKVEPDPQQPGQSRASTSMAITMSASQQTVSPQAILQPVIRRTPPQPSLEHSQVPSPPYRQPSSPQLHKHSLSPHLQKYTASPQAQKPMTVPVVSIAQSYPASPTFQPAPAVPISVISQPTAMQMHQVKHPQRQMLSNIQHGGYPVESDSPQPPRYQPDHLSAMPVFHSSPHNSPARSPARSPNRSPVPPPRHSPVSQAELAYYKQRLLPQESPPPYSSAVRSHELYRRFQRRNSTGGLMLSTSNLGPGRGFSFSIGGHGGPINVSFTQQRGNDPTTQVAFEIPREVPGAGEPNQITYALTPEAVKPGDSLSFNYTTPQYPQAVVRQTQGGSYDDSKVIQISYPPSGTVPQQRRLSPNSVAGPDYFAQQEYVQRQEYMVHPVKPEAQYPAYQQPMAFHAEDAVPRTSPRSYLSPPAQHPPPPPYPYTKRDWPAEDTSALSQSKSFKNLENKFLLGGNVSEESSQPPSLTSGSCRKPSGVSMQENHAQVPQPAASARPYIPPLPEHATLDDLDLEAVERKTIERYMKERLNLTGDALSTDRTPPGLFAFFDKSFSEKLLERQFRRKPNYGQSETLRLVKEMDEQQKYEGN